MITTIKIWLCSHIKHFLSGVAISIMGYFAPVQDVIMVMVLTVIVDMITGIWASVREGRGVKSRRLTKTAVKIVLYAMIIYLLFCVDKELQMFEVHRAVAWLIVGFEIWSILENAARITDHPIFRILKKYMNDRVKETTGVRLDEEKIAE